MNNKRKHSIPEIQPLGFFTDWKIHQEDRLPTVQTLNLADAKNQKPKRRKKTTKQDPNAYDTASNTSSSSSCPTPTPTGGSNTSFNSGCGTPINSGYAVVRDIPVAPSYGLPPRAQATLFNHSTVSSSTILSSSSSSSYSNVQSSAFPQSPFLPNLDFLFGNDFDDFKVDARTTSECGISEILSNTVAMDDAIERWIAKIGEDVPNVRVTDGIFKKAFENLPWPALMMSSSTQIVYASKMFCTTSGMTLEEVLSRKITDFVDKQDFIKVCRKLAQHWHAERNSCYTLRERLKDGKVESTALVSMSLITDPDCGQQYMISMGQKVDDLATILQSKYQIITNPDAKPLKHDKLAVLEEKIFPIKYSPPASVLTAGPSKNTSIDNVSLVKNQYSFLDGASVGFVIVSAQYKIIYTNARIEKILGFSSEFLEQQTVFMLVTNTRSDDHLMFRDLMEQLINNGRESFDIILTLTRKASQENNNNRVKVRVMANMVNNIKQPPCVMLQLSYL